MTENNVSILVIDDEEMICRVLTRFLSKEGHRVEFALSGEAGLERVRNGHYDLVFLDLLMSGLPGMKVLPEIKNHAPETKVVIMTGKKMDSSLVAELEKNGAAGFVRKPFGLKNIQEAVKNVFRGA